MYCDVPLNQEKNVATKFGSKNVRKELLSFFSHSGSLLSANVHDLRAPIVLGFTKQYSNLYSINNRLKRFVHDISTIYLVVLFVYFMKNAVIKN